MLEEPLTLELGLAPHGASGLKYGLGLFAGLGHRLAPHGASGLKFRHDDAVARHGGLAPHGASGLKSS